jgi:hypothetical protein
MRILVLSLCLWSAVCGFTRGAYAESWKEHSKEHFIIYYKNAGRFAADVGRNAEIHYKDIATGLGYPRYSDFWTWDKRVKIYIYPDHETYVKKTGMQKWSHGMADYEKREIASYDNSDMFIHSVLPHEIAHLIFRDFVGFTGKIPLWLDEGVAQWAEKKKRREMNDMAVEYYDSNSLLSLDDLMNIDVRDYEDEERLFIKKTTTKAGDDGVLFLDTDSLVTNYYLVAVSLIDFLITKYGSERFAQFCRELRDHKTVEESLKFSYPNHITSLAQLEEKWRKYLSLRLEE